ncbi:Exopolyphosphatase [Exophiala xenobiotica]|uniref:Exopolyphosphatase n=1 Tax=Lithohypha guttulata TaxID=1690604 RepID=A0ABR0KH22_9EURO|nr:Exopolyphosphatase [Lithohypha guttulata]KAK5323862.1 Exopolyphosphatase [Exophiala xenobiotica]
MQLPLEDEDDMRLPGFSLGQDLTTYLSQIRKVVFSQTEHKHVTLVLGNPSCDLDSFISAFTLSYFYNSRPDATKHHKAPIYVPVLNLPYVETEDLWRLRPEFGVAIRGAFDGLTPQAKLEQTQEAVEARRRREKSLLGQLITLHELANNEKTLPSLRQAFQTSDRYRHGESQEKVDIILVDHNAPAIETVTDEDIRARFEVVGCIDHHVEENYVPKQATPRVIRFGIGSCTTLVTEHLRKINLWTAQQNHKKLPGYAQISRLTLAPILVDTWDLKAPGDKCSDLDRDEVAFLDAQTGDEFDREDLFHQTNTAKYESLNLLRMQEIFARDYKSYAEELEDGSILNVGIASVFEHLEWLSKHAKGRQQLVQELVKYAQDGEKVLEVFGLLTKSGDRKEVGIFSFGEAGKKAITIFENSAKELQLKKWNEDDALSKQLDELVGAGSWKIWWMGDISKSRKQVAPLLRNALKQTSKS